MIDFKKIIDSRQKYPILNGSSDMLFDAIKSGEYACDYALLTFGLIQKNKEYLFKNYYPDILIQIPSPFAGTKINFILIHLNKNLPKKVLTGIYREKVCYNTRKISHRDFESILFLPGEFTEDFLNLLDNINKFLEDDNIEREDLSVIDFDEFDIDNVNPAYYTRQALSVREELKKYDCKSLQDFADVISSPTNKNIFAKYIDSRSFKYPLVYSDLDKAELKNAIKVQNGDIICLLVGEKPKFYLFSDTHDDIYIKSGNYCILRCKDKKYESYLINYLNDEKARMYITSHVKGTFIQNISKSDLINMKVITPTDEMLKVADATQKYLMNKKQLSPYEVNDLIRNSYKYKYEQESQKMVCDDMLNLISNMKIKVLQELISDDMNEVDKCFNCGAYKSAIILCGSILEAVLLDWLSEYEDTDNIFDVGIKDDGRDLELSKIINELKQVIKPYWYEANEAHEIRKTRNMVHPKECIKNKKKVTMEECKQIINDLKDILESRENRAMQ